ncbi:hypothetical protein C8Q77DRAFT_6887 [Trametes polyzona]|nr:hypothetical protein C8Q77DRAFT_6887 [Trametes polyzona]
MSSSSTPIASSSDLSFFSKSKYSAAGSSTVVTTRVVAVPRPPGPTPAIKLTARPTPSSSSKASREADLAKRKSEEALVHAGHKRRRVSPEVSARADARGQEAPPHLPRTRASSRISSSSRQTSVAPSPLSNELFSAPSTRATSVASATPPSVPARECWIDGHGKPGPGFLSSESIVRDLMKGYKACEYIFISHLLLER